MADPIEESLEIEETSAVEKSGYAAVPIHFRPGEGKIKKFKLVIPGIEPPLGFYELTGNTPETLDLVSVEGPDRSVNAEDTIDVEKAAEGQVEGIDDPDAGKSAGLEDVSLKESDNDSETDDSDSKLDYPHEMPDGSPVSGFLVAKEDGIEPVVIIVHPKTDESVDDSILRVASDHPDHKVANLDEAIKALGHSPLTTEDNPPILVDADIPGNPKSPVAWLLKGRDKIAIIALDDESADDAITRVVAKHPGYKLIKGAQEPDI